MLITEPTNHTYNRVRTQRGVISLYRRKVTRYVVWPSFRSRFVRQIRQHRARDDVLEAGTAGTRPARSGELRLCEPWIRCDTRRKCNRDSHPRCPRVFSTLGHRSTTQHQRGRSKNCAWHTGASSSSISPGKPHPFSILG
jgi:hypothetical protein